MRALSIDTSTHRAQVALSDGASCAAREANDDPRVHAERLVGLIDRAMSAAGWTKSQIDLVACCVGPGSFTGVRVALATAKGIALGLGRPIVGVGSLEAMASAAPATAAQIVVPLLDAKKGEVFWAAFDGLVAGPGHVAAGAVSSVLEGLRLRDRGADGPREIVLVGEIATSLALPGVRVLRGPETDLPDAMHVARLGVAKYQQRGADDLHALEPVYVRPPDIAMPKAPG
jgi:tRNA threonylcarbamoyladenosine biosynthesis protein TsaB